METKEIIASVEEYKFEEPGKKEPGYSQRSVDDFRQALISELQSNDGEIARVEADNAALQARVAELEEAQQSTPAAVVNAEADVSASVTLLSVAEKVAREHVTEAESKAESIVADAEAQAEEIIASRRGEYLELNGKIEGLHAIYEKLRSDVLTNVTPLLSSPNQPVQNAGTEEA